MADEATRKPFRTTRQNIFMFSFKEAKIIGDENVLFFHDFVQREENQEKTTHAGCLKPKVFLQNVL